MREQKAAVRMEMMTRIREMTAEEREASSEEICERILEMSQWAEAQNVILFSPLPSEPIITPLKLDCQARRISCTIVSQSARSDSDLQLPETIDLVLVPGIAFSKDRHRLGRGGGFFDRLLAGRAKEAFKLGICFSFQVMEEIPVEEHDMAVDIVVTN